MKLDYLTVEIPSQSITTQPMQLTLPWYSTEASNPVPIIIPPETSPSFDNVLICEQVSSPLKRKGGPYLGNKKKSSITITRIEKKAPTAIKEIHLPNTLPEYDFEDYFLFDINNSNYSNDNHLQAMDSLSSNETQQNSQNSESEELDALLKIFDLSEFNFDMSNEINV